MTLLLDHRFYSQLAELMPVSPVPIPTREALAQKLERWARRQSALFGEPDEGAWDCWRAGRAKK